MRKIVTLAAVVGVGVLVVQGCGGGICSYSKACPNDPMPTAAEIKAGEDSCNASVKQYQGQPCYGEIESYANCGKNTVVCTAQGTYDSSASRAKAQTACASQLSNAQACCAKNPSSQICH